MELLLYTYLMHMPITITMTKQWQIYIPKQLRQTLNIEKPGKVKMQVKGEKIIIEPIKSGILSIAGKYAHKKPVKKINVDKIRDYIDYSEA